MKHDITELESNYKQIHAQSVDIGKQLASSIDMLSVGEAKELIATSIVEMESMVNRKDSLLEKLPFMGRYFAKARDKVKEENIKSGSMVATVERLFKVLNNKNENMLEVMSEIFKIRDHTIQYVKVLQEQEKLIEDYLEELQIEGKKSSMEYVKASNLLVQVRPTIIKGRDNVATMTGVLNTAEQASVRISSMLPALQGEMQTELAINAAIGELSEFKEIFDSTVDMVSELNHQNVTSTNKTIKEVAQLQLTDDRQIKQLENNSMEREKLHKELAQIAVDAEKKRDQQLVRLSNLTDRQTKTLAYIKEGE